MTDASNNSDNLVPPDLRVRYTDLEFVGAGGMGRIVSAHDTRLDKRVAIKLLPRNSENALAVMRFQQEAKAVSKLNNSHVVQVLDFGYSESGEPYLVMEYVKGEDLDAIIKKRGPLPIAEVLNIAIQVCDALEHAHTNGIVHRDLKPGNIMIDASGNVRVLDFGLARIMSMDEMDWRLTRPGQPVGSISYMSPEQIKGEEAGECADIYSLGLVVLKMVTGELPFEEHSAIEIVTARLEDEPPVIPIRDDAPELCKALRRVVSKALIVDATQRYASMKLFKDALSHVESRALTSDYTASAKVGPDKKRPNNIVPLVVISVLAVVTLGSLYVFSNRANDTKAPLHKKRSHDVLKEKERREAERNYMLKTKFRIQGAPETGVWIGDSSVTDADLDLLSDIPSICQLYFEGNHNITEKGLKSVAKLPIGRLTLREMEKVDNDCVPIFNSMTNLTYLDVYECGIEEAGIMQLKPNSNLIHLNVKKMDTLTKKGLKYIVDSFPNLDFLSISGTGVEGESIKLLPRLKKLKTLEVAALELKDADVACIGDMTIEGLDISNNPITDKTLTELERISTLKSIYLDYCAYLSPRGIKGFRNFMKHTRVSPEEGKERVNKDLMELFRE